MRRYAIIPTLRLLCFSWCPRAVFPLSFWLPSVLSTKSTVFSGWRGAKISRICGPGCAVIRCAIRNGSTKARSYRSSRISCGEITIIFSFQPIASGEPFVKEKFIPYQRFLFLRPSVPLTRRAECCLRFDEHNMKINTVSMSNCYRGGAPLFAFAMAVAK